MSLRVRVLIGVVFGGWVRRVIVVEIRKIWRSKHWWVGLRILEMVLWVIMWLECVWIEKLVWVLVWMLG